MRPSGELGEEHAVDRRSKSFAGNEYADLACWQGVIG